MAGGGCWVGVGWVPFDILTPGIVGGFLVGFDGGFLGRFFGGFWGWILAVLGPKRGRVKRAVFGGGVGGFWGFWGVGGPPGKYGSIFGVSLT